MEPRIPLLLPDLPDPQALRPWLEQAHRARRYANFGPLVLQFEQEVAEIFAHRSPAGDTVAVTTVSSATVGLELVLQATNLPSHSAVLLPALTFPATATAVVRTGHRPVFADVDPVSWQLTPTLAEDAIRRHQVAAVIPVAVFGNPVAPGPWEAFSSATGVQVVIDAAAAFEWQEPSASIPAVLSLHATKPVGVGEGGLVVGGPPALTRRVRELSNFGFGRYIIRSVGTNGKLSEFHAAVGLAQLRRLDAIRAPREAAWAAYRTAVDRLGPAVTPGRSPAGWIPSTLSVLTSANAGDVAAELAHRGIETRQWYCPGLDRHPALEGYRGGGGQVDRDTGG